jgi:DNA-binding transcriptional LysR family regulator
MDRLACLTAFVETARLGGMAAAARKLDVPRAKISRQIQTLEAALGAQLLVRTTRALTLTEAGGILLESASEALDKLGEAEQRVRDGQTQIRGTLRINAPMSFGVRVLAPLLPKFQRDNPLLELQVGLSDEFIDPVRGGFDVTLRIAHIADSTLVARQLCDVPRVMVAAPDYLARRGTPGHANELAGHAWLGYGYLATGGHTLLRRGDETVRVVATGPLCANNGEVLMQAAIGGLGIVLLPRFIVEEALARHALEQVLPEWRAPETAVYAMFPPTRRMPARTRRLIDYLIEAQAAPRR